MIHGENDLKVDKKITMKRGISVFHRKYNQNFLVIYDFVLQNIVFIGFLKLRSLQLDVFTALCRDFREKGLDMAGCLCCGGYERGILIGRYLLGIGLFDFFLIGEELAVGHE